MRRIRQLALAALLTLGLPLGVALPAAAQPPVWIVKDKDSEIVLFGSVHVLPHGLDWRPPALIKALQNADDLWFELPIDPQSEAETSQLAMASGVLPPGQSLTTLLGPGDTERLAKLCAGYGVPLPMLDRLKPWLAEIALAAGAYRRVGADAASGVEQAISAMAPAARRQAFESPTEQIALLSGGPIPEQLASLRETLKEMEDDPDEFATLVKAWMAGDVATLRKEALDPLRAASPDLFRRLVTERNARWAQVLDARMKGHGRTVVVVGVGHLIGPNSVPARLRALGYSVTGP
jgi:uncharacterized protein YbaP (TraB family)